MGLFWERAIGIAWWQEDFWDRRRVTTFGRFRFMAVMRVWSCSAGGLVFGVL